MTKWRIRWILYWGPDRSRIYRASVTACRILLPWFYRQLPDYLRKYLPRKAMADFAFMYGARLRDIEAREAIANRCIREHDDLEGEVKKLRLDNHLLGMDRQIDEKIRGMFGVE
jgi:hypothetical protein